MGNHRPACSMNTEDLTDVVVYPNGDNYSAPPDWASDDYVVRKTTACNVCGYVLYLNYDEPIASCECGAREWYH